MASASPSELVESLADPSPEVARAAVRRLVEIEGDRAAAPLRARLLSSDLALVRDIAKALRRIGDRDAVDVAIAGLAEKAYTRRLAGARALGALGDPRGIGPLRATLRDEIAGVRVAALDALAEIAGAGDAATDCARLLADTNAQVRVAAVRAVARAAKGPVQCSLRWQKTMTAKCASRSPGTWQASQRERRGRSFSTGT